MMSLTAKLNYKFKLCIENVGMALRERKRFKCGRGCEDEANAGAVAVSFIYVAVLPVHFFFLLAAKMKSR